MYCPKCGAENRDDAKICTSCSSALSTVSTIPPASVAKTSGLAIASLVLAILSPFTCFITAIPAIVLGIMGLCKINKSAGQLKGQGLAIAGICVPAVALPIVATILMGILMPAFVRTRPPIAHRMVCATNMNRLGKAMLIYASDYDEKFPTPSKWCDLLIEYADATEKQFRCKGASEGPCNYAMNENVERLNPSSPPDMVLLFETKPGWNQIGGPEILTTQNHYGDGCNIVFVDLHVEFVRAKDLDDLKWTAKENE